MHGLGSDDQTTWKSLNGEDYWPIWLHDDLPQTAVWSITYPTSKLEWFTQARSLVVVELGRVAIELAALEGLGERPIVWVTHSLGGLVVKQALRSAEGYGGEDWQRVLAATRSIVFLGTPHQGSAVASAAKKLKLAVRPSETTLELIKNSPQLQDLNDWFRTYAAANQLRVKPYYETEPLPGGLYVVDPNSADPSVNNSPVTPVLGADHTSISRPADRASMVYRACSREVQEVTANGHPSIRTTVNPDPGSTPEIVLETLGALLKERPDLPINLNININYGNESYG